MSSSEEQSSARNRLKSLKSRYWQEASPAYSAGLLTLDELVLGFVDFLVREFKVRVIAVAGAIEPPFEDPLAYNPKKTLGLLDQSGKLPVIYIRGRTAEARRYTLVHELVHLVSGDSGTQHRVINTLEHEIEAMAAEILMPALRVKEIFRQAFGSAIEANPKGQSVRTLFSGLADSTPSGLNPRALQIRIARAVARATWFGASRRFTPLHQRFRVSEMAMARRLCELDLVRLLAVPQPSPPQKTKPVIFISYSNINFEDATNLDKHLAPLVKSGGATVVWDKYFDASDKWEIKLDKMMSDADIAVCLISADYLKSENCQSELRKLLDRPASDLDLVGVVISDCMWEESPFGKLEMLPKDEAHMLKPVRKWAPHVDTAWTVVSRAIASLVHRRVQS